MSGMSGRVLMLTGDSSNNSDNNNDNDEVETGGWPDDLTDIGGGNSVSNHRK